MLPHRVLYFTWRWQSRLRSNVHLRQLDLVLLCDPWAGLGLQRFIGIGVVERHSKNIATGCESERNAKSNGLTQNLAA